MSDVDTVKFNPPENHYIQLDIQFATQYGVNEALLFAKLYRVEKEWHGFKDKQGIKWVRLTYDEWLKETPFFSRNTIIRTLDSLVDQGLICARVFNGRSKWYRCNQDYVNLTTQNGYIEQDYDNTTTQNGQKQLPKMGTSTTQNGLLPKSLPNTNSKAAAKPKKPTPEQLNHVELARKMSTVLGYDKLPLEVVIPKLNKATQWLASIKATPADVEQFERYWWGDTPPSLNQVKEFWPDAMAQKQAASKSNINPLPGVAEAIARIEAQNG